MANLTPGYLKYLEGEIADRLEDAYKDDGTPHGEAFEDKLLFVIQTYCQQHDQAGEQTAAFVRLLECNGKFDIEGAVGGLMILRRTRKALAQLLQHDAEFLASYRGDSVTSEEVDRSVRNDAREFTERNEVSDEVNRIVRKTAAEGEVTEEQIANAAYDSDDGAQVEFDVALSARNRLESPEDLSEPENAPSAAESVDADVSPQAEKPAIEAPMSPAERAAAVDVVHADMSASSFGGLDVAESPRRDAKPPVVADDVRQASGTFAEEPKKIAINVVSQFGKSPSIAFNNAKEWFMRMIVQVAAGSETRDSFPRIRPLINKPELKEHGTTQEELRTLAREIGDMTRRLRPPLSETSGDLEDMMKRALDAGRSGDVSSINDVMQSFTEMFGGRDDDKFQLGLDGWKKDGGYDDE